MGSGAPLKKLVGDGQETVPQYLRNRATFPAQPGSAVQVGSLPRASWYLAGAGVIHQYLDSGH